jgi:GTPase SAR1 family protein
MIAFTKRVRRFVSNGAGKPAGRVKDRPLAFCSNADATIFAYYANSLRESYEGLLHRLDLGDCVVGYRQGYSNVTTARDAFAEITSRGRCAALALDIEGFFDNIPHAALKAGWARVLALPDNHLPPDHYAVFMALTRFSRVDRDRCLDRLGLSSEDGLRGLPTPLCTIADFRTLIRGTGVTATSLIETNRDPFGIPQGTPLSPAAANIAMLAFDAAVAAEARRLGASYRRYSDDILIVCAPHDAVRLEDFVQQALDATATGLKLKPKKAQRVQFYGSRARCQRSPLQYLGFTFDGRQILLRSSTLARQWRKLAAGARWAKARHSMAVAGEIEGRANVHRKSVFTRFSHLGEGNFHTGYAALSSRVMMSKSIGRQLRNHMSFLADRLR